MKRLLFAVLAAALLISCEKENVIHTGDITGSLYGIWQLDTKTVVYNSGNNEKSDVKDYSNAHFYLSLSEPGSRRCGCRCHDLLIQCRSKKPLFR